MEGYVGLLIHVLTLFEEPILDHFLKLLNKATCKQIQHYFLPIRQQRIQHSLHHNMDVTNQTQDSRRGLQTLAWEIDRQPISLLHLETCI